MEDNGLGNSEHFVPVKVGADLQPGALIDVTIEAVQDGQLVAA
jgi:hypothetical protein